MPAQRKTPGRQLAGSRAVEAKQEPTRGTDQAKETEPVWKEGRESESLIVPRKQGNAQGGPCRGKG
jgi:hypothetical protein